MFKTVFSKSHSRTDKRAVVDEQPEIRRVSESQFHQLMPQIKERLQIFKRAINLKFGRL